jgi:hypothetical protein
MTSSLTFDGPSTLTANSLFHARLSITPAQTVRPGGRVVVAMRHVSDYGPPQREDPAAENHVGIEGAPGCRWRLNPDQDWKRHPWNRGIDLTLEAGEVPAGAVLTLILGGAPGSGAGYRCQSFAEEAARFRLGIDPAGEGAWEVVTPAEPFFRVVGAAVAGLRVVVPDCTGEGARRVVLKPEDAYGNVAGEASPPLRILAGEHRPLAVVTPPPGAPGAATVPAAPAETAQRLTVASDDGRCFARSNPTGPSPVAGRRLFFGEIHSQSGLCDGTNSPATLYRYAREAAGLDFAAVSSHDMELTDEDWETIRQATRQAHRPGAFVTFLGYEWSGATAKGGDNNVYFADDEGPLLRHGAFPNAGSAWDPAGGEAGVDRDLAETIAALPGAGVMVVPHGGGRCCNLDFYDPRVMPLLEIHSCHRSYEHIAFEAIGRGLRFGFIGGSDDHRGAPGDSHPAARERFFSSHSGLVAVYADDLTRASLWEAFFARRVYATNGCRPILDVRLGETVMGGEVRLPVGEPLGLSLSVVLDGLLDRVELLRGTEVVRQFRGAENQVGSFAGEHEEIVEAGPTAYWVKVVQADGGTAWSSPIWVDGA